jgi:biopolymer transport protein ExbD
VLRIEAAGGATLDGVPRDGDALRSDLAAIRARDTGATVVIQGDAAARYERVVAMIDLCNEVQIGMSIATARIGF